MTEGEARGVVGAVSDTANKLISSLPTQFLVLVLMNTVFIAALLYFLDRENAARGETERHLAEARERVLVPLLTACLEHKGEK